MTDGKMKDSPRAEVIKLLNLVADIREAVGDPEGKLMQSELVERCRELRAKAEQPKHLPLHNQLKAARKSRGLSLRKLGEISGVQYVTIHEAEQSGGNPTLKTLTNLSRALGVSLVVQ